MGFTLIRPGLYQLTHDKVNVFLVDCFGLTLIDTGHSTSGPYILRALRELGHDPASLGRIILTHSHPDHAGSAAYLKAKTGAQLMCHLEEARLLHLGRTINPSFGPSPGLLNRLLYQTFIAGNSDKVESVETDRYINDGEELVGDIRVVLTPGHSVGHLAFLWRDTLIAGDAAANVGWLRPSIGCEDFEISLESIQRLSQLEFDIACFGHGPPIKARAAEKFRNRRWTLPESEGKLAAPEPLSWSN